MNIDREYRQIDIMKIAQGVIRRFWIVLIAMLLCGSLLLSYAAFFVTPLYESSVLMYVNNSSFSVGAAKFSISSSEISAARSLVETYLVILKTRMTLNDVISLSGLDCTWEELSDMISAGSVNNTEVFSVTVRSDDPYEAERIANTIARVLPDKIASVVEGSSVRIVDYAVVPSERVSPSLGMYTLAGLAVGMVISCGAIAIREIVDDRIRSEQYLLESFRGIPLLAVIPDMLDDQQTGWYDSDSRKESGKQAGKALFGKNLTFAAKEAYKLLRTNLMFSLPEREEGKGHIVGITSSVPGEGKSTTTINLASTLAEQGERVLVIEGDLRLPSLHKKMEVAPKPGLSDILVARGDPEPLIQTVEADQINGVPVTFDVLVSGEIPPNPSELIGSNRMKRSLEQLATRYQFILLDLPPVIAVTDALVATKLVDGVILVVRNDYADSSSLREAVRQLRLADARILGFVFSCADSAFSRHGEKYKHRYYADCQRRAQTSDASV